MLMSSTEPNFVTRYTDFIIRFRWVVVFVTVFSVFALASGARHLYPQSDYRIMFGPKNPQLVAFDEVENVYTKLDSMVMVVHNPDGTVFNENTLVAIRELTNAGWQTPHSSRVDSVVNYQHSWATEDDLIVEDLVPEGMESDPKIIARAARVVATEPILAGNIANAELNTTVVSTRVHLDPDDLDANPEVVAYGRALIEDMRAKYPELRFELTGPVMMSNAFFEAPGLDSKTVFPAMFALLIILTVFFTRSVSGTIATLGVIILSTLGALGAAGFYGYGINPINSAAPVVILTLAIADSIHILLTMLKEMSNGSDKVSALRESIRINAQPVFLTSITTAIGFLVMNFSDTPPFHELGNITAFGVLLAWVLSVTFFPALLSILPVRSSVRGHFGDTTMARIAEFNIRHRKKLVFGVGGLIVFLIASISRMEINDTPHEFIAQSVEFRPSTDFYDEQIGFYFYVMSIESGSSGGINNPAYLKSLEDFAEWLRVQPDVAYVGSYVDVAKKLNMNMHGDDPTYRRVPEDRELAAQYLLLYEMSLPFGLDLNDQIDVEKSATRMLVGFKEADLVQVVATGKRADVWLAENGGALVPGEPTGPPVMFAQITKNNLSSMLRGTALGFVLISIILMVSLRSPIIGLLSLVPNIIPAATAFGIWALTVREVGFAISVVAGLSIGIIVDDTVHFLSKYSRARREMHLSGEEAVRYAFTTVGQALFSTSLIVSGGFAALMLSTFSVTATMGALTSLTVVCALGADFFLLPALLLFLDRRHMEVVPAEGQPH
jgi:hypothetical protein